MATASPQVIISCLSLVLNLLVSNSLAGIVVEKKSTRMSRMPIFFGKRSTKDGVDNSALLSEQFEERDDVRRLYSSIDSLNNPYNGDGDLATITHGDNPSMIRLVRYIDDKINNFEKGNYNTLSMATPYMGKSNELDDSFFKTNDYPEKRSLTWVLNRMPAFYSDKLKLTTKFETTDENDKSRILKRNILRRMPAFYGKRSYDIFEPHSKTRMNIQPSLDTLLTSNYLPFFLDSESRISFPRGSEQPNRVRTLLHLIEAIGGYRSERNNKAEETDVEFGDRVTRYINDRVLNRIDDQKDNDVKDIIVEFDNKDDDSY